MGWDIVLGLGFYIVDESKWGREQNNFYRTNTKNLRYKLFVIQIICEAEKQLVFSKILFFAPPKWEKNFRKFFSSNGPFCVASHVARNVLYFSIYFL